ARLRVGIGKVPAGWDAYGYVLGKFAGDEANEIPNLCQKTSDALTHIIEHGMISAMNRYN
ncbi:MAG: aminoacyl-tRNA hydrolase, partial [Roseiflexaceae bacterium]